MTVGNYKELAWHVGHQLEVVKYGDQNVAVECIECSDVILDFDVDQEEEE